MKTHSSILTWLIPQTEEPGGLMSTGSQKSQTDLAAKQQDDDQASKDNLLLVLISIYSNWEGRAGSEKQLQAKGSLNPPPAKEDPQ